MKALVKAGEGEAEVRDIEKPSDGTVVETLRVGIDGTDREVLKGSEERIPDGEDFMVMGHEAVGRVVESPVLEEGTLVVPTVRRPGEGCGASRPDFCAPSSFVERGISGAHGFCSEYFGEERGEFLVPIPDELEELGVLVEPTSVVEKAVDEVYRAQQRLEYEPERALVMGGGSIGLLTTMLLRKKGLEVETVDVVDSDHSKAELVESVGAEYVDNRETGIEELGEFDFALEASGVSSQLFKALKALGPRGALVSLGIPRDESAVEKVETGRIHREMVVKNKIFLGSVNSSVPHFEQAIEHLRYFRENFPVERILDVQASLDNWRDAFEKPEIKGEIVFNNEY